MTDRFCTGRSLLLTIAAAGVLSLAQSLQASAQDSTIATTGRESPDAGFKAIAIERGRPDTGQLDWKPCNREDIAAFECATLTVPLDRTGEKDGEVALAVIRSPATGASAERIGSLFFNPGGPGGSGLDFMPLVHTHMPPDIARHYDLVSWDPRGVGETRPVLTDCAMPWVQRPEDEVFSWTDVFKAHYHRMEAANRKCQETNKHHINFLGTMNVVEDLDALRAAVGDKKLYFAGYSYGTRIGSVYAQVHPDKVGAMLLDGPVDPSNGIEEFVRAGGRAMDEALGHYFQFESGAPEDMNAAWKQLSKAPIDLPDEGQFTRWDFLDIALLKMTFQAEVPQIGNLARRVVDLEGNSAAERTATIDAIVAERAALGPNTDTGGMVAVVNCLDYADRPNIERLGEIVSDNAARGGVFGGSLTTSYGAGCAGFTFEPDPIPLARPIASEHPVLISGATRDSRTPYQWAVQMARAFPESRMLTYPGGNHVNWFISSECLKGVMDDYFVDGYLPAVDTVCPYVPMPAR